MLISPKQAIDLEMKLNKSNYTTVDWIKLGDILYKWRLDPKQYVIDCPLSLTITDLQMKWVAKNIIRDVKKKQML